MNHHLIIEAAGQASNRQTIYVCLGLGVVIAFLYIMLRGPKK